MVPTSLKDTIDLLDDGKINNSTEHTMVGRTLNTVLGMQDVFDEVEDAAYGDAGGEGMRSPPNVKNIGAYRKLFRLSLCFGHFALLFLPCLCRKFFCKVTFVFLLGLCIPCLGHLCAIAET